MNHNISVVLDVLHSCHDTLTNEEEKTDKKLQAIDVLKYILCPGKSLQDKVTSTMKFESLLNRFKAHRSNGASVSLSTDVVIGYGVTLFEVLNSGAIDDVLVVSELEWVFDTSKEKHFDATDLFNHVWSAVECSNSTVDSIICKYCDEFTNNIEQTVFSWVKSVLNYNINNNEINVLHCARISSRCAKLYQMFTSVLNQFLVELKGHDGIMVLISLFVEAVKANCQKSKISFFNLYPKPVFRLTTLLNIHPDVYAHQATVSKERVVKLVAQSLQTNQSRTLTVLSHFPHWIPYFKSWNLKT